MPNNELSPEKVLTIIKEIKQSKINDCKHPTFALITPLYNKYGKQNIRPAIVELVKTKKIKLGETINDYYLEVK